MADTIFVEDCDFRMQPRMRQASLDATWGGSPCAKGFLGKHTIDASFGQFRTILKYVGKRRDVFVGEVDHRGSSQTCPNCRCAVHKELGERVHSCTNPDCLYEIDREIAAAQELCNRGTETYRGTPEKQEIGSQVVLSGNLVLDKWRGGAMPISDDGKPALYR